MPKVLVWDLEVGEFELQSFHYIHFQIKTLRKVMNPLIPPAMS